jgi:hypothetical protein
MMKNVAYCKMKEWILLNAKRKEFKKFPYSIICHTTNQISEIPKIFLVYLMMEILESLRNIIPLLQVVYHLCPLDDFFRVPIVIFDYYDFSIHIVLF